MKKVVLALFSALIMVFSLVVLSSCGGTDTESKVTDDSSENTNGEYIALKIYNEISKNYIGKTVTDYREIVSLSVGGFDMTKLNYGDFLSSVETNAESYSEFLISLYFLNKCGIDISEYNIGDAKTNAEKYFSDLTSLSTISLSKLVISFNLWGYYFNKENIATELYRRIDKQTGGFFDISSDTEVSAEATSMALICYMAIRQNVKTTENETFIHDSILNDYFIENDVITENNTLLDETFKESCISTATAVTALISAEIPQRGVLVTAMLNAIETNFKSTVGAGYANYKNGTSDVYSTSSVLLAAVSSLYGCPFIKN